MLLSDQPAVNWGSHKALLGFSNLLEQLTDLIYSYAIRDTIRGTDE